MKEKITTGNKMAGLAVLLVFCVFAVCIMMVLLQGASVCRTVSQRNSLLYEQRTCSGYLTEKVRQAPAVPDLKKFGDGDGLILAEDTEGETWYTCIYCHDGWLREYYGSEPVPEELELGEKVLPARSLHACREGNLLTVSLEDTEGGTAEIQLCLRNGGGL